MLWPLGLVDSGASFNFMSCVLYTKLGWRVDKQQQALVGKWNGGEKQRTCNRNSAARPMARADLGLSVGIVI